MKISEIPRDELELMSYDDIAALILQENGKKMKLQDILKKICQILELPDGSAEALLMEVFEQLSINKKFIMLKNGYWDLQSRHKLNIVIEDDEEETLVSEEDDMDDIIDEENEDEEDIFYDGDDETDDVVDDELSDFMVVDSEEEESNL
jgi:DNA-directed RNA polymerase subunit delta